MKLRTQFQLSEFIYGWLGPLYLHNRQKQLRKEIAEKFKEKEEST